MSRSRDSSAATSRRGSGGFSPLTMMVVLLIGVVSLAGLGVLSAYAPELKSGNDGGEHALSRSSIGYAALPRLLSATRQPVILSRGELGAGAEDSLLVLTPTMRTRPESVADLDYAGPRLIILPKWHAAPYRDRPGWVTTLGTIEPDQALSVLPEAMRAGATLTTAPEAADTVLRRPNGAAFGAPTRTESPRRIAGAQWIPVVVDAQGAAVLVMHRHSRTYVLADADLVNTQGVKSLNGAKTALALLDIVRAEGSPVVFDLTLHGFQRTRNLLRLMLEPPLLGMTLVLAALAAFAGWQAVVRFGPPRRAGRALALGKSALADNTASLVRMARREHHMAAPYAQWTRSTVARAVGAPRDLDDAGLDAFLDRVGVTVGTTHAYTALAGDAQAAKTAGDLMRVARNLHRWTEETTRARQ
ncbi:DUF4350 domain-containing protein [Brevundimonas sp. VNH65]|uniref:DUF4350 domain-containing protein n=1 Tax=Brevundimonas sp. VNH65 TaxID=3400917 RepID=UPI003C0F488D